MFVKFLLGGSDYRRPLPFEDDTNDFFTLDDDFYDDSYPRVIAGVLCNERGTPCNWHDADPYYYDYDFNDDDEYYD